MCVLMWSCIIILTLSSQLWQSSCFYHCDIMIPFRCSLYVAVMSWHSRSSIVDLVASQCAYVHMFVCRCRVGGSAFCPLLSVPCSGFSCNALWRLCSEFFQLCFTPCALCLLQRLTLSIPLSHVTVFSVFLVSLNVRFDNPGSCYVVLPLAHSDRVCSHVCAHSTSCLFAARYMSLGLCHYFLCCGSLFFWLYLSCAFVFFSGLSFDIAVCVVALYSGAALCHFCLFVCSVLCFVMV